MLLVTGANGFVGRHVVRRLAGAGREVRAMVRDPGRYQPPEGVGVVAGDLTDPGTLPGAVTGIHTVIHCAAITANLKEPYRGAYSRINAEGTRNLVAAAADGGVGRLVVMSGLGTCPAPEGTYMATRWAMEEAVRGSGIPHVILQPSVLFGEGAEFVTALAAVARKSPVLPAIGGGKTRFQPIWIEDVVTCVEKAAADGSSSAGEFPIGGAQYVSFDEILRVIAAALGKHRLVVPLPTPIARLQARLMSALLTRPPLTPATLELFGFDNATELDAVDRAFGFHPRGFRDHLRDHGIDG